MAWFDVIRSGGSEDILVWKYQARDVNEGIKSGSQLIVNEGQEAVFFKSGKAFDVFGPGRHTLSTTNLPLLQKFVNLPFGGKTPFPAEVYFVNKTSKLDYKWGTQSPIQVEDPRYGVLLSIRAFGQYGLKIGDSRKLVTEFVGTMREWKNEEVTNHFKGLILSCVSANIAKYLVEKNISIAQIQAYQDEISDVIKGKIRDEFSSFGIDTLNFNIVSINIPPAELEILQRVQFKDYEIDHRGKETYLENRRIDVMEKEVATPVPRGGLSRGYAMPASSRGINLPTAETKLREGVDSQTNLKTDGISPAGKSRTIGRSNRIGMTGIDDSPGIAEAHEAEGQGMQIRSGIPRQGIKIQKTEVEDAQAQTSADAKDAPTDHLQSTRTIKIALKCPNPKCGVFYQSGSNYCDQCGSCLCPEICPKCGVSVSLGAKFCQNCRNPMT